MAAAAFITDTSADLPPDLAAELGIHIVPASCAFTDHNIVDGSIPAAVFYERMASSGETPLASSPSQHAFEEAYRSVLESADRALCLLAPLGVIPTYTTANGAAIVAEVADRIKISNPGVASAGLCAMLVSLGRARAAADLDVDTLLDLVDEMAPRCDALFVPADVDWLDAAGRLQVVEERVGPVEDGIPVVRVGTRITGVSLAGDQHEAFDQAVAATKKRFDDGPAIVVIDHAAVPDIAEQVARVVRDHLQVAELVTTELSPTVGSQLGPGAVGIGIAPAPPTRS